MSVQRIRKIFFSLTWLVTFPIIALGVMPMECQALEITIDVAPNVLNIQGNSAVLTIHTDIDFHAVNASTVSLAVSAADFDPVSISWWKADDCGNFVAKFSMNDIKEQLGPDDFGKLATFKLEGETTSGEAFWGAQDIMVVNNESKGASDERLSIIGSSINSDLVLLELVSYLYARIP